MRLLQLTPKPPYPPYDGGAIASTHFIELWKGAGWQAHGLTMNTYKHPYDPTYPTPVPFTAVAVDTRPTPLGALRNLLLTRRPYHVDRFSSPAYREALRRLLETFQPDLIQVESPYLTPYIQDLSTPAVYRLHNIEWQIWQRHAREQRWPLRWYFSLQAKRIYRYEQVILHAYAGLLPISEKEADWAQNAGYTGPMEVFPFGIEVQAYPYTPPDTEPPTVGFIGGLDWLPNQEGIVWFLEQVWPIFRRKHPRAELFIAGRNCPKWLYRYADAHTHILGAVPDAKAFLQAHPIFIAPLFSGSGIRIKLIEAFAMGRAIVATPIAAESLIFEEGKHLLLAETPQDFVESLSALYVDVELRLRLGAAARCLAETHYDRAQHLPKLSAFYARVLGR